MRNIAPRDTSELEAIEQREWLESLDYVIQQGDRGRVQRLLAIAPASRPDRPACRLPFTADTPYVNTHPPDDETPLPGSQEIERRIKSLVRWNAMAMVVRANRVVGRHRRPHLDLRLGGDALRSRLQPLLPRQGPGRRRRPHLLPGPRLAGHLRARVPRRPAVGRAAAQLPPASCAGRRALVVSAPVADAGLLGVPDGLDGPRPDHGDLPGALQALPRRSRAEEAVEQPRCGRSSATARPTSPNRSARSPSRRARSSTT